MLDLSTIEVKFFDVKLPDGSVVNIKPPTLSMKNEIATLAQKVHTMNEKQQEKALVKLVTRIFNRNVEDREFKESEISKWFDESVLNLIVVKYTEFIAEVVNQKN